MSAKTKYSQEELQRKGHVSGEGLFKGALQFTSEVLLKYTDKKPQRNELVLLYLRTVAFMYVVLNSLSKVVFRPDGATFMKSVHKTLIAQLNTLTKEVDEDEWGTFINQTLDEDINTFMKFSKNPFPKSPSDLVGYNTLFGEFAVYLVSAAGLNNEIREYLLGHTIEIFGYILKETKTQEDFQIYLNDLKTLRADMDSFGFA